MWLENLFENKSFLHFSSFIVVTKDKSQHKHFLKWTHIHALFYSRTSVSHQTQNTKKLVHPQETALSKINPAIRESEQTHHWFSSNSSPHFPPLRAAVIEYMCVDHERNWRPRTTWPTMWPTAILYTFQQSGDALGGVTAFLHHTNNCEITFTSLCVLWQCP